ncbi:MAG: WbqC family protein [Hyphomicrobiales bacterium]
MKPVLTMILTASRPYFAPCAGYFRRADLADLLVILDAVQFPRGTTWLTRNRFKNGQGTLWMTIPVHKKGLGLQPVQAVRICWEGRWMHKLIESLRHAYKYAPYLEEHLGALLDGLGADSDRLIDLNLKLIGYLMQQLRVSTPLVRLSELGSDATGTARIVDICRRSGASIYLAQRSARSHLDAGLFEAAGIELRFVTPPSSVYPQLWGDFIPDLSAFDLLFNCGPKAGEIMRAFR